jgi:hypothetical protein
VTTNVKKVSQLHETLASESPGWLACSGFEFCSCTLGLDGSVRQVRVSESEIDAVQKVNVTVPQDFRSALFVRLVLNRSQGQGGGQLWAPHNLALGGQLRDERTVGRLRLRRP